ncbi:calmodulin-binding protein 25-like [Curcuma longa]|uniref:calmodulin-binding protein 25-like n=1 Tax=Curcuma longa TaxID=136217 RepID=UPI003D9F384D
MENSSVLDPWRHRPHGISGGGDCAGLLSESFSAVSAASVRSPESMSSFQPPRRDPSSGRIARKRKSRACKRSPTTYIAASPAHFRELVQRVTGNRSAEEMNQPPPPPPPAASAGSRAIPALDWLSAYDRAGLFQPAAFGSDPALAEFDPLLLAASGFPALDSWQVM